MTANSRDKISTGLPPFHPGKLFTLPKVPVTLSSGPAQPIPIPRSFTPLCLGALMKQGCHLPHGMIEATLYVRGALVLRQNTACLVDDSHRDLGAANVNPADHVASHPSRCCQPVAVRILWG